MLVIQHNCRKALAITIAALETGLSLNAAIVCLQEPYNGKHPFSHPGYALYWPEAGTSQERRVVTAIRRDLIAKLAIETRTDLVDHPYIQVLDIWELQGPSKSKARRT